ncbi:MAG TPA: sigma-54 dependent transcriptional regulator [Polyangiales bacterium]|nr:sigma-54 dependent transcriptional regulator [Polyangiales bacterium]
MLGASPNMRELFAAIERLAKTELSVLVLGETGTGKELVAEALHRQSARSAGPFVVCDLSAIGSSLIESELFGHRRGAFTGAERDRAGAFAQAHGGTLFLDEVGELEPALQPRLLRAIERKQIKPVGSEGYVDVDVRIIAATNRDLAEEARAGRFRLDLYHRLAVVSVCLPSLRERQDDIVPLAQRFLQELSARRDSVPPDLSDAAAERLRDHAWPGNVRELRNVVERALSLAPEARLLDADAFEIERVDALLERVPRDSGFNLRNSDPPAAVATFKDAKRDLLDDWERGYLRDLLTRAEGNVSLAARWSGLARGHLHRLLRKHSLSR